MVETRQRAKVSVTVNPDLLREVDAYVQAHPGADRSKIFDEALRLWYGQCQEQAMERQFAEPEDSRVEEELAAWKHVQREAARRIFER